MFCLRHFDEVTDSAAKEEWHQWFHEGPVWFPKHVGNYIHFEQKSGTARAFFLYDTEPAQREVARSLHGRLAMLC